MVMLLTVINVMLCYVMLCYVMLCYVMLCYVICYVMLRYVMWAKKKQLYFYFRDKHGQR